MHWKLEDRLSNTQTQTHLAMTDINNTEDRKILAENVSVVENFLKKEDWHCTKENLDDVVIFRGGITGFEGMYATYGFCLIVGAYDIQCFADFPAKVMNAVVGVPELICRINCLLKYGCFELNCDSGELRFHICVPAVSVQNDTQNLMRFLLLSPARILDRYAAAINAVSTGVLSPKESLEKFSNVSDVEVKNGK